MTSTSYHHTVNVLQVPGWDCPGPFARPEWFALLEAGGMKPLVALACDGEAMIGLALTGDGGVLSPLTNWYAFTFAELRTADAPPELLAALARDLAKRAHRIDLAKLAEEDLARFRTAFAEAGWLTFADQSDINHILPLNGRNFAQYLADRPGQLRTTLKRKAQ